MSLEDVEFDERRERFRKELVEKCKRAAEERGEEFRIITKVISFTNDDVPNYLALLERIQEESRTSSIMVCYCEKNYAA